MMKKILTIALIVAVLGIILYLPYTWIPGTYVNVNYENSITTPNETDTLILLKNGRANSFFFQDARYVLSPGIFGTKLEIYYENGRARFSTTIEGGWFNQPKILVFRDLNHHYVKVE